MDNRTIPRFFYVIFVAMTQDIENDMNALINAHTQRGRSRSPHAGLTSNVLPEAQRLQTGVSSEYVQKPNHYWFVLRVTYNRTEKASGIISASKVQSYMPMHYVVKKRLERRSEYYNLFFPIFFLYMLQEKLQIPLSRKRETSLLC